MFGILAKGGPVMIPLLACSLAAVAVAVERGLFFHWLSRSHRELLRAMEEPLSRRNLGSVGEQCQRYPSPLGSVLSAFLQTPNSLAPSAGVAERAERWGEAAAYYSPVSAVYADATRPLERFLPVLDTIVTMAPLLGLLGTVTGMIRSFGIISLSGIGHPTAITGGVAEALIATAFGLAIAIFSLFFYNLYQAKAESARAEVEAQTCRVLARLGGRD